MSRPSSELERAPRPSLGLECSGLVPRYNGAREEFERRLGSLETRLGGLAKLLYRERATGSRPVFKGRRPRATLEKIERLESFLEEADLEADPGPVVAPEDPESRTGPVVAPEGPRSRATSRSDFRLARRAQNGRPASRGGRSRDGPEDGTGDPQRTGPD